MTVNFHRTESAPLNDRSVQHLVPMRDGVRIATDVYLPEKGSRHPAVLCRLPYDKASAWMAIEHIAPYYLERGYAFVVQDVRGKFRSEGETMPFVHEIADTYDSLEWLSAQSWSNGAVGMIGDSYHGFTQWAGAASGHRALKAIAPRVTGIEIGGSSPRGFNQLGNNDRHLAGLYQANYFAHFWVDNFGYDFEVDWSVRPLRNVFDAAFDAIGTRSPILDRIFAGNPPIDPMASRSPFAARPIPVLHRVGWFDNLIELSMQDYRAQLAQPGWSELAYLDADACDHHSFHLDQAPVGLEDNHALDLDVLHGMMPRYLGQTLDFFDVHVAGTRDAAILNKVTWCQGHVGTRTSTSWPPADAYELRLYPGDGSHATTSAHGGTLDVEAGGTSTVGWTHDPQDPVPATVNDSFTFLVEYPDESVVHDRADVVTFTGEALDRPLDLAGPVRAVVAFETAAPSMDLFVKLHDVAPDGVARLIVRGQQKVFGQDQVLVDMTDTGYRVRAGHRLRLQISCSDFPLFAPHPGTAEDPWLATTTTPTDQQVRLGAHETYVSLTITDSI